MITGFFFVSDLIFESYFYLFNYFTGDTVNLLIISQTSYINYTKEPTVSLKHSKALNNLGSQ